MSIRFYYKIYVIYTLREHIVHLIYKNVGLPQILKDLIKANGLTVAEFARKVSIPQPTIQRITSGKHARPHQKTLNTISNFFDITVDQLCGLQPISWLTPSMALTINKLPLINIDQLKNRDKSYSATEQVVVDINVSPQSFAIRMPDASMEPLIRKNSILIVDPEKIPQYKNFIVVMLKSYSDVLVRQLIKDANNCYIKPLNHDFENTNIIQLSPDDVIFGVVVEIRLYCEDQ